MEEPAPPGSLGSHTCDKTVLPGDGRQVVAVDVSIKLKDLSRLKCHINGGGWKMKKKKTQFFGGRNYTICKNQCTCIL